MLWGKYMNNHIYVHNKRSFLTPNTSLLHELSKKDFVYWLAIFSKMTSLFPPLSMYAVIQLLLRLERGRKNLTQTCSQVLMSFWLLVGYLTSTHFNSNIPIGYGKKIIHNII